MRITEKQFQQQVLGYAKLRGWLSYHTYDSRRSAPGFPDLVLVRGERLIFAELKTDTGSLTEHQKVWASALMDTEAEFYIWRPSVWGLIEERLK